MTSFLTLRCYTHSNKELYEGIKSFCLEFVLHINVNSRERHLNICTNSCLMQNEHKLCLPESAAKDITYILLFREHFVSVNANDVSSEFVIYYFGLDYSGWELIVFVGRVERVTLIILYCRSGV